MHVLEAFVTLVTSDEYGLGAIVLAHSIRDVGTTRHLVCMITDGVSALMRGRLGDVFDDVIVVDIINSTSAHNLHLIGRPDLIATFTKLNLWNLVQYSKVVFMDADTLVLHNIDELFSHDQLSACPDIGWPDCFNSGVFVAKPSKATFDQLITFSASQGSFDGGDQGILNDFFPDWKRLPFTFNVTPSATYSYSPAYRKYRDSMKVVHFIGSDKPWRYGRYSDGALVERGSGNPDAMDLVRVWWSIHDKHIGKSTFASHPPNSSSFNDMSRHYSQYSNPPYLPSAPVAGGSGAQPEESPANPFFKSRYDWDANELGINAANERSKIKAADEDEDEHGSRKLPLKKAVAQPSSAGVKPAGPARAQPSASSATKAGAASRK